MSEFNDLIKMLEVSEFDSKQMNIDEEALPHQPIFQQQEQIAQPAQAAYEVVEPDIAVDYAPFNIDVFTKELYEKSSVKNQLYKEAVQNISAYDISSGCIREVIYKLANTPVESFADKWLPILMRSTIGTAIHDFIQNNSNQFTEREVSLKIPSIRFSGRLDNLIGPKNLIEIKSCPYSDYEKIITTRKPRVSDFYQAMTYKYILENYIDEARDPKIPIRKGTRKPKFEKYEIDTVQFIYIAHDVTATDVNSFGEILERIKQLKRLLNSKSNSFFFITTMLVNVTNEIATPFLEYVDNKIKAINNYMDKQQLPPLDDPYVDTKACFFCIYYKLCKQ